MYQNSPGFYQNSYSSSPGSCGAYGGHSNSFGSHNSYSNSSGRTHSPHTATTPTSSGLMARINESEALSLLQHLGKEDLQHLLDNDSKLKDLVDDLPQLRAIQQEHDDLIATNKSLAEYNLSLQPKFEDLKQTVASLYESINTLKTDLAQNKANLDTFVGHTSLDTMLALLQTEAAKSEEESEELADKFCSKEMDLEEFVSEYLPKKTLAHLRRIKSERLAEMLREGVSNPRPSVTQPLGATSGWGQGSVLPPYPDRGAAPPYPTSAFGMPQPNLFR